MHSRLRITLTPPVAVCFAMAVEVEPEGTWHWNRAKYQSKTGGVKLAAQAQSHEHTQKPSEHATGDHRCTPVTSADPTGCVDISTGTSTGGVDIYIGGCGYIHTPVDISTPVDVVVEIRKVCGGPPSTYVT